MRTSRLISTLTFAVIALSLVACGGGGSSQTPVQPPSGITITTTTLTNALVGSAYSATMDSTCTGTCTWSIQSGALPDGLSIAAVAGNSASAMISGTPSKTGTFSFTAQVTNGSSTATKSLSITVKNITISTNMLSNGFVGVAYYGTVLSDCPGACVWTLLSGRLPDGLTAYTNLATSTVRGTPTKTGTYAFTLQVSNGTTSAQKDFTVRVDEKPVVQGRNDSIATATPLSSGMYTASISPYADVNGQANPDTDYYAVTAKAGATVQIDVDALNTGTIDASVELMDPVVEILDVNGNRLSTCQDPADDVASTVIVADKTPTAWDDVCMNDDRGDDPITGEHSTNSTLRFRPSGAAGSDQTFYIHVIEWRGDARPDILYTIAITGAN